MRPAEFTHSDCWTQRHVQRRGLETLLFPHPGPVNTGALARKPVQLVGGSEEGQRPAHLMTDHQEG